MEKDLKQKVLNLILEKSLLSNGDSVLLAVSGGADSVCLLDVLCSLKESLSLTIYAAHLNHLLRGDEALRDEEFVSKLCKKYGVKLFVKRVDVKELARKNKTSLENAGRCARYSFFTELKEKYNITKIATAHNKNDNAETVCMRFMRGSGINGLSGIPLCNDLSVIRPLLFTSRKSIEAYLKEKGIDFVTDSTNLEDDFSRNKIRHNLIPYIENNHNESFIDTLSENIVLFSEANDFLDEVTDRKFAELASKESFGISFDLKLLLKENVYVIKSIFKKTVLKLSQKDISARMASDIYSLAIKKSNSSITVNHKVSAYNLYEKLYFVCKEDVPEYSYKKGDSAVIEISETNEKIIFCDDNEKINLDKKNVFFLKKPFCDGVFTIRNRRKGDKIYLGKMGHKKIKDLFIDEKIPQFLRDRIPILLFNDEIVWVLGVKGNPKFIAKKGDNFIKIAYFKENENERWN